MINLDLILTGLGVTRNAVAFLPSADEPGSTIILLDGGSSLTYTPAPVKAAAPVETHTVAYFGYRSSTGRGCNYSRRVIVDFKDQRVLKGYETSNEADYQYKSFLIHRMIGDLRIVQEEITGEDRISLPHLPMK